MINEQLSPDKFRIPSLKVSEIPVLVSYLKHCIQETAKYISAYEGPQRKNLNWRTNSY